MPPLVLGDLLAPATVLKVARARSRYRWFREDIDASVILGRVVAWATAGNLDREVSSAVRLTVIDLKHSLAMARPDEYNLEHFTAESKPGRKRTRRPTPWRNADAQKIAIRNALIVHALQHGFSRIQLGLVFDLSRTQVANILSAVEGRLRPDPRRRKADDDPSLLQ